MSEPKLPPSEFSLPTDKSAKLHLSDVEKCSPIALESWASHFSTLGWLKGGSNSDNARSVLQGLERFTQPLEELRKAGERPRSQFLVDWSDPDARGGHWVQLIDACKLLSLRAEARMAQGSTVAALNNLRLMFRLVRSAEREPGLLSGWIHSVLIKVAYDTLWNGLRTRSLDDTTLKEVDELFAGLEVPGQLRWMLESERALQNNRFDHGANNPDSVRWIFESEQPMQNDRVDHSAQDSTEAQILAWWYLRSGTREPNEIFDPFFAPTWLKQVRVQFNEVHDELLERVDVRRQFHRPAKFSSSGVLADSEHERARPVHGYRGTLEAVVERSWLTHTRVQQARIAIALERYRLKHDNYPADLSVLVPDYLPAVPHDLGGAPMCYRLDPERRYVLHAVGMDLKDDGGAPPDPKSRKRNPDWVWTYPAQ